LQTLLVGGIRSDICPVKAKRLDNAGHVRSGLCSRGRHRGDCDNNASKRHRNYKHQPDVPLMAASLTPALSRGGENVPRRIQPNGSPPPPAWSG
jgi:hypothetical protein